MSIIVFPSSPTLYQTFTVGSKTWVWNGYAWDLQAANSNYFLANSGSQIVVNNNSTFYITNTTVSTSNTTGALTVAGGLGVSGNIYSTNISANTIVSGTNIANNSVGYLGLPQNIVSLNYTLVITDSGKHIYMTQSANTGNVTIPQNSSVPFPVGTIITLVNSPTYSSNIVNTGSSTLYVVANSTPRTSIQIGSFGIASLIKIGTDTWYVSGSGIT